MKKHKFEIPLEGWSEKEKARRIKIAAKHYAKYMDTLLPGWQNDVNSKDTPLRVAKAFVEDIAYGLYNPMPRITDFDNIEDISSMVFSSNITVQSLCSHHHQNIFGVAHVAYIPSINGTLIGLSKLNRIVTHFARTPQLQENLTKQIHDAINELCEGNLGVAVIIHAKHMCVSHRGINDQNSDMITPMLSGGFSQEGKVRNEFYNLISMASKKL